MPFPVFSKHPQGVYLHQHHKGHHSECRPPSFFSPSFIYGTQCYMLWTIPLVTWGQRAGSVPSQVLVHPQTTHRWSNEQKMPWCCIRAAQLILRFYSGKQHSSNKHIPVLSMLSTLFCVSSTKPKHSPIPVTVKQIKSIPFKISTPFSTDQQCFLVIRICTNPPCHSMFLIPF